MKCLIIIICTFLTLNVFAQSSVPSWFEASDDIGNIHLRGNFEYDGTSQQFTLTGSGQNIWDRHDDFRFAWKKLKGDFILDATIHFIGSGKNAHRKIGWMVRQTLAPNAVYADAAIHGDGLSSLQFRRAIDSLTEEVKTTIKGPDVIRFERRKNTYILSAAHFGQPLAELAHIDLDMGDDVYAGLFISSHEDSVLEKVTFSNVRITVPAKDDFVAYKDYPGSRMETVDVLTGERKMLFTSPETFEAPQWTKDNTALIYNSKGKMYRYEFASEKSGILNTGTIIHCNNDHIMSPDGKLIGISSHEAKTANGNASLIYTVSATGGLPVQLTKTGPSYLHGWSPDGKTLVYCAERNHNFDVYAIPAAGGKETRLTAAVGLDDGPEYSPDGQTIFFNSARTGTMQIWKMKPDGTDQRQVTNDEYNNWFAHISPDGKWMSIISFSKDVKADDHPPCKKVLIRLLPVSGQGPAKVIADVYGGQGTINVPSWSPDGKHLAFVSYSF